MKDLIKIPFVDLQILANEKNWKYRQLSEREAALIISGGGTLYEIHCIWQKEIHAIHLMCVSHLELPKKISIDFFIFLMHINQKVLIGHFCILENNMIAYCHTIHLGYDSKDFERVLSQVVEIAVEECESFFPGFEKILKNETVSAEDLYLLSLGIEGNA